MVVLGSLVYGGLMALAGWMACARRRDLHTQRVTQERDSAQIKLANIEDIAGRPDLDVQDAVQNLANEADAAIEQMVDTIQCPPKKRVLHIVVPMLARERELARLHGRVADDERLRLSLNALMHDVEGADDPTAPGIPSGAHRAALTTLPGA